LIRNKIFFLDFPPPRDVRARSSSILWQETVSVSLKKPQQQQQQQQQH